MLEAVGLGEPAERVYRLLLARTPATFQELVVGGEMPSGRLRDALATLESAGLVSRTAGRPRRYLAVSPDVGIEALVLRREEELLREHEALERTRVDAQKLLREFRVTMQRNDPLELVEVVSGFAASLQRFERLQRSAKSEVLILVTPPYRRGPVQNDSEFELLRRGIAFRVIYDRDSTLGGPWLDEIARYAEAGEQARVLAGVPVKLAIADREVALVALGEEGTMSDSVVVHASPLLDALRLLFEVLWADAVPLDRALRGDAGGPDALTRQLLTLMSTGVKDETIARQLGVSVVTVRRRIGKLLDELGADTRFQAALRAARRGWL